MIEEEVCLIDLTKLTIQFVPNCQNMIFGRILNFLDEDKIATDDLVWSLTKFLMNSLLVILIKYFFGDELNVKSLAILFCSC